MVWEAAPGWRVEVPPVPIATITAEADALAARITAASVPAVPFTRVQPLDAPWATSSAERITFAVGAEGSRTVEVTLGDAVDQRHNVLVTGAVGQGKSNLLSVVVHSLAARYSPDELELHLLDFKEGVTLYPLAPTPGSPDFLPHARVLGLESDREFGVAALEHVEAEFARRARLFRPHGDSIAAYRRTVPDAVMPRIVVVVDEFHMLFDPADETADRGARVLEAIARRGRSYGVHLVLASQTVAGISALMTRENGIFAQFPIRIALKNALTESFASLAPGNDGAARLRARGTAILNLDYGEVTANRTVVIAAADAEELAGARRAWWAHSGRREHPPLVFDGSRRWRPVDAIGVIRDLRAAVIGGRATPAAVVGMPVAVGGPPASVPLSREPGRHLAVLGAGEDTRNADEDTANVAVGVLQTAALSLAMQHPRGDAEFVAVDLLDDEGRRRADQDGWLALMARLGFPVRTVGRSDLAAFLAETASVVRDRAEVDDAPSLYVVGFALDRAVGLDVPDAFANRPVEAFQDLLVSGPAVGVHVLGWWTNVATWKAHIGLMNEGSIDGLLLLRLDRSATADAVGPLVPWTVRDNRGLLLDSTQRPEPTVIVPSSPLAAGQAAAFAATDWGTT
nr:FtsK/SpoIIIE domain-containing protein [Curtobacterium pusillum]